MRNTSILITRPRNQISQLESTLTELGAQVIVFPSIEIVGLEDEERLNHAVCELRQTHKVIFLSANAVEHFFSQVNHFPKVLSVFAVGLATATALKKYNVQAKIPVHAEFNSEGLLSLPDLQTVAGEKIMIISGEGGRNLLAKTLSQRGAEIFILSVYRRTIPCVDIQPLLIKWRQQGLDIIISTSGESLRNLVTLIGRDNHDWLLAQQLLVISQRVAVLAKELGFNLKPILASTASDAGIVEALISSFPTSGKRKSK